MRKLGWILVLLVGCSKSADHPPADKSHGDAPADHPADPAADPANGSVGSGFSRKHKDRREPVIADAPPLKLEVTANGATTSWQQDSFDKVPRYTKGNDGEARDV